MISFHRNNLFFLPLPSVEQNSPISFLTLNLFIYFCNLFYIYYSNICSLHNSLRLPNYLKVLIATVSTQYNAIEGTWCSYQNPNTRQRSTLMFPLEIRTEKKMLNIDIYKYLIPNSI